MGKSPKVPKPEDALGLAAGESGKLLSYYGSEVPKFLQLQELLGPQIMGQMFDQTGQFLGGIDGQPGFQGLLRTTAQESGQTLGDLRADELGQMTGQAGLTRGLMDAISPEQAAVVRGFATEAERARAAAQGVTPQERRAYEQQSREGFQAAGRLGGNQSIVDEAMQRENVLASKRAEAARAGGASYDAAQKFYTEPGLQSLRSAPLSYGAGLQTLGTALTGGPASSGEFDYNMPLSFAQQRAGALDKYNMAKYQAKKEKRAQTIGLISQGIGLAAAPFTGGASLGLGSMMTKAGAGMGSTGLFNAGVGLYNSGLGAGGIPKASIV